MAIPILGRKQKTKTSRAEIADRADALAKQAGTTIPPGMYLTFWCLPILEALVKRVEALEKCACFPKEDGE